MKKKSYIFIMLGLLINFISNAQDFNNFNCTTVNLRPTLTLTTEPTTSLTATRVKATFTYDNRLAYYNYITLYVSKVTWKVGGITIGSGYEINLNPTVTTTYTCEIRYDLEYRPSVSTLRRANNCLVSKTIIISPKNPPVANAGSDKFIPCYGESTQLDGRAEGVSPPYTFKWSPESGLSSATVANPIATPLSSTNYSLTVTDSRGVISNKDEVIVYVPAPDPLPIILNPGFVYFPCPGKTNKYSFHLSPYFSNINATSLSWQISYGFISKYHYTGTKITGIEVTLGEVSPPSQARASISRTIIPESLKITCTAFYECGPKVDEIELELRQSLCAIRKGELFENPFFEEPLSNDQTTIFPNPSTGKFVLDFHLDQETYTTIEVFNFRGTKVFTKTLGLLQSGDYVEEIQVFDKGEHIIRLVTGKNIVTKRMSILND
jgi:hypothetical protein